MDYHFKAGSVSSCGVNDYRKKRQQLNINNNACRNNRIVSGYNLDNLCMKIILLKVINCLVSYVALLI